MIGNGLSQLHHGAQIPDRATPRAMRASRNTALACDADCVVTDGGEWLPYAEEFERLSVPNRPQQELLP